MPALISKNDSAPLFLQGKGGKQGATELPLRWSKQQPYEKVDPFRFAFLSSFCELAVAKESYT
jgi:hypothetical protein